MANNAAWAGLGNALKEGGDAYAQAQALARQIKAAQIDAQLKNSEIGKNNAIAAMDTKSGNYKYGTDQEGNPVPVPVNAPPNMVPQLGPVQPNPGGVATLPDVPAPANAPAPVAPSSFSQSFKEKKALQDARDADALARKGAASGSTTATGGGRGAAQMLNFYQKGGMNSIASGAAALDRLTQASNALGQNDDNALKAIAGHYAASNPNVAAMLQTKQGQPLSQEDRQNIFIGVKNGVADEINKLSTQSNSAVTPGMFENAVKIMPDERMDANHRATALANMKEMLLRPGITKYLDAASSVMNPDGTFPQNYKAVGLENQYKHALGLHKQIFGQDYTGATALTAPNGSDLVANPNGSPAPGGDRASQIAAIVAAHKAKK